MIPNSWRLDVWLQYNSQNCNMVHKYLGKAHFEKNAFKELSLTSLFAMKEFILSYMYA